MTRLERQHLLQQWHDEWSGKWADKVTPDPAFARDCPSQYAEGAVDLDAPAEAMAEYWAGVERIYAMN